jgi:hypothetical protein
MIVRNNSMANIDKSKLINNDKEQRINKNSTKVVIITSVDDDNDKILSYLNPSNIETFFVDLNNSNLTDIHQRSLTQLVGFYFRKIINQIKKKLFFFLRKKISR